MMDLSDFCMFTFFLVQSTVHMVQYRNYLFTLIPFLPPTLPMESKYHVYQ